MLRLIEPEKKVLLFEDEVLMEQKIRMKLMSERAIIPNRELSASNMSVLDI